MYFSRLLISKCITTIITDVVVSSARACNLATCNLKNTYTSFFFSFQSSECTHFVTIINFGKHFYCGRECRYHNYHLYIIIISTVYDPKKFEESQLPSVGGKYMFVCMYVHVGCINGMYVHLYCNFSSYFYLYFHPYKLSLDVYIDHSSYHVMVLIYL